MPQKLVDENDMSADGAASGIRRKSSDSSLRQRPLNRASTFAEGSQSFTSTRRRSSLFSVSSADGRQSSTDNLLRSGIRPVSRNGDAPKTEELSHWHSIPLVFAVLPAAAGLLFNDGSAVATDMLLLGLSTMFLNWCIRVPWEWYHAAQEVHLVKPSTGATSTIFEEEDDELAEDEELLGEAQSKSPDDDLGMSAESKGGSQEQLDAASELRSKELSALAFCFLGPVIGAYLLHYIRAYLSRPSEGLVSNYNLTIFVLAAEIRPFSHIIQLQRARILHLQRVVQQEVGDKLSVETSDILGLVERLEKVEGRLAEDSAESGSSRTDAKALEIGSNVRQSLQPQLDALNRAVRRYEKRSTTKEIQTEARLNDLEARLRDALSLAASAARTGQKPGFIARLLAWISNVFAFWLSGFLSAIMYPWLLLNHTLHSITSWFRPSKPPVKKRAAGKNGSTPNDTARIRPRSPR